MAKKDIVNSYTSLSKLRDIINDKEMTEKIKKDIDEKKVKINIENKRESNVALDNNVFDISDMILDETLDNVNAKDISKKAIRYAASAVILTLIFLIIISLYFKNINLKIITLGTNFKTVDVNENKNDFDLKKSENKVVNQKSNYKKIEDDKLKKDIHQNKFLNRSMVEAEEQKVSNPFDYKGNVNVNTAFEFTTYYKKDGKTSKVEKWPTHKDVNASCSEISSNYPDWNITSFEETKVCFERELDAKTPDYYLIKLVNGKVCVYEVGEDDSLHQREVTELTYNTLSKEEIQELEEGIYIYGKDAVIRRLETLE